MNQSLTRTVVSSFGTTMYRREKTKWRKNKSGETAYCYLCSGETAFWKANSYNSCYTRLLEKLFNRFISKLTRNLIDYQADSRIIEKLLTVVYMALRRNKTSRH
jgi:hypothetical protein